MIYVTQNACRRIFRQFHRVLWLLCIRVKSGNFVCLSSCLRIINCGISRVKDTCDLIKSLTQIHGMIEDPPSTELIFLQCRIEMSAQFEEASIDAC